MKIERYGQDATVTLTMDEIDLINNALNEVCNALDVEEFSTRMGFTVGEVEDLLRQINTLGDAMRQGGARRPGE